MENSNEDYKDWDSCTFHFKFKLNADVMAQYDYDGFSGVIVSVGRDIYGNKYEIDNPLERGTVWVHEKYIQLND